jgi:hypothetical protein
MSAGRPELPRDRAALNARLNIDRAGCTLSATSEDEGLHNIRDKPLTADELYVGPARPIDLKTPQERAHQACTVCRQVKSHPVS